MDKLYRLYTEDLNRGAIVERVGTYFPGFNIREAEGYYKGQRERAIVIELMAPAEQAHVVKFLAAVIKQLNRQECVLVTVQDVDAEFIQ
jgi:hypothetical protein